VRSRIEQAFALIVRTTQDAALERHDHGSDRHLVFGCGDLGLFQRHFHVKEMEWMPRITQKQFKLRRLHAMFLGLLNYGGLASKSEGVSTLPAPAFAAYSAMGGRPSARPAA
jgi:hypothetical protein